MKIRSEILVVAAFALLGSASVPAAMAPIAAAPDGAEPQSQQESPSYSDEELKTFVVAVIEVQRINKDYMNRLGAVTNNEEQERVLQSAANEMTQVVTKNGMTVDRFTEILNNAQMNPQLASRVRKHMNDVR